MVTRQCPECAKEFSRSDNLKRHMDNKHSFSRSSKAISNAPVASCDSFQLQHPFTCMVAGMTGCGKTVWVQKLLEQAQNTISLPPQRIVWCYSQWQPAYTALLSTVPGVEFVKGIPPDLEKDHYFDVNIRNMIVIDDQMTETGNDLRISNLFTKGSHHRNLSVFYIVQNLFHQGKSSRSISLNSHYLVLFKNPRDKLQVLTLAKQMYPKQTDYFLSKYEEAVHRPYGYLFVDLKPNTPERCRLRTNILPGEEQNQAMSGEDSVSRELLKYLQQQNLDLSPVVERMQSLKNDMNNVLYRNDLGKDQKVRQYIQLQNDFLRFKHQRSHNPVAPTNVESTALDQQPVTPQASGVLGQPQEQNEIATPLGTKISYQHFSEAPTVPYSTKIPSLPSSPAKVSSLTLTPTPSVLPSGPLPKRRKRARIQPIPIQLLDLF